MTAIGGCDVHWKYNFVDKRKNINLHFGSREVGVMRSNGNEPRWWEEPEETLRKDIHDALVALRHHVENQSAQSSIILSTLDTYKQRELRKVHTTRVGEWEFGYQVKPLDEIEGFFMRTIFAKLRGGKLDEINKRERSQVIDALTSGILDEGTQVWFEDIDDTTFAIRQPFAVMFWKEGNPNVLVPSQELFKVTGGSLN